MYWGQPLWGIDGLGYVSGYISRPPGLYLVLGAAVVLALLCIFPLRRRKGEKTEESPTGRCMATNAGEKTPTESVAGCGDGGGSPHLDGKACVCGGI